MKSKLLKRLRKRFSICIRNREYIVLDNSQQGYRQNKTSWISKEQALCERRKLILEAAQEYKVIKRKLND